MAEKNRLALDGPDKRVVDVAELVGFVAPGVGVGELLGGILLQAAVVRAHRHEKVEPVAAIDVHALGDGPEAVRGVKIAVVGLRPGAPPQTLSFFRELDAPQVVQVPALAVQHFAEHALAHQVQGQHFTAIVAAILHHEAMLLQPLRGFDELPAVVHAHRRGHFGGRVFAVLHRGEQHRHVPLPRRRRVHEVEILLGAHALEVARPARVAGGFRLVRRHGHVLRARDLPVDDVADGFELDAFDLEQVGDVHAPHSAHPHEADAHALERWCSEQSAGPGRWFLGRRYVGRQRHAESDGSSGLEELAAGLTCLLGAFCGQLVQVLTSRSIRCQDGFVLNH